MVASSSVARWSVTAGAGLACLLHVSVVAAQSIPYAGRHLSITVGPLFIAQRDEKASPVRYGGAAPFIELAYSTGTTRRRFDARIGGAYGGMRSSLTRPDDLPRQQSGRAWLDIEYSCSLTARPSGTRWFLGGLLSTHGTLIEHHYTTVGYNDAIFAFFSAALGPVVSVSHGMGDRVLSARLGVPFVALVARPYDVFVPLYQEPRPSGTHLDSRIVTMWAFRAVDFSAAYTAMHRSRTRLVLGYRLVVERYSDDEPFRFASQALSVTLAIRIGGK
jgi:hypothetical protein